MHWDVLRCPKLNEICNWSPDLVYHWITSQKALKERANSIKSPNYYLNAVNAQRENLSSCPNASSSL